MIAYGRMTAAFMTIAICGSWYPFRLRSWTSESTLLGDLSWTDLTSNVLLFFPIGLFLSATIAARSMTDPPAMVVVAIGATFSAALELVQGFISARTPAGIDVVAQSMGIVAGLALWCAAAGEIEHVLARVTALWDAATRLEHALVVYTILFAAAWLFPFDFTLRPDEVMDKYAHQRLLLPFVASPDAMTPLQLQGSFAAAIPLGLATALCGRYVDARRPLLQAFTIAAIVVCGLELLQAMVFSRTTDATALVALLPGAALGAVAGSLARART